MIQADDRSRTQGGAQLKRTAILLALTLALLATVLLAAGKRIEDTTHSVSVIVPKGWTSNDSEFMGAKLILLGPRRSGFATSINLTTEKIGQMSLSQYSKISGLNAPKLMKAYKLVSLRPAELGGASAMEWVYSGVVGPKDTACRFKCLFAVRKGLAYTLTYTSATPYYKTDVAAFDSVAVSLKWRK
jgi:hypothetical protein